MNQYFCIRLLIFLFIMISTASYSQNQNRQTRCLCSAPVIISQPTCDSAICVGNGQVFFTVTATGTGPFTYQWQEDLVNITDGIIYNGCNTSTLTLTNPSINCNGKSYRCIIKNCTNTSVITDNNCILSLTVMPTDINSDGVTNNADFAFLLRTYDTSCAGCREDINQDGMVNIIDFLKLVGRFNKSCF
ncbi:MAG: hypothetical protein ABI772_09795 [Bacteroidota bacterium]